MIAAAAADGVNLRLGITEVDEEAVADPEPASELIELGFTRGSECDELALLGQIGAGTDLVSRWSTLSL